MTRSANNGFTIVEALVALFVLMVFFMSSTMALNIFDTNAAANRNCEAARAVVDDCVNYLLDDNTPAPGAATAGGSDLDGDGIGDGVACSATQPNSNVTGDTNQFTVGEYAQKPAAVMGDAVMILSNNWQDYGSKSVSTARVAAPTTFNSAIVSGAVVTTSSAASGGAHNFPRFLEDWSGRNFVYHGSMCELYASTRFTGTYGKANVYSPPNRRWFFDDNFLLSPRRETSGRPTTRAAVGSATSRCKPTGERPQIGLTGIMPP